MPSRASRRGHRAHVSRTVTGLLVVVLLVGVASLVVRARDGGSSEPTRPAPRPTASATPVTALDLTGLVVHREPFCALLEAPRVRAALAGRVRGIAHYGSGQRVAMADGLRDVSHEFDCTFRGAGAQARAWVFAAPVDAAYATRLARDARRGTGCRRLTATPRYGDPTVSTRCRDGRFLTVALRGRFGNAWLACSLRAPVGKGSATPTDVVRRGRRWCVDVARAAAG